MGRVTPGQSINLGNQWKPGGGCLRSKVDALMPRWLPFRSKIVTWTSIAKAWYYSAVRLHCVEVLMIMMLQHGFPRLRRLLLGTSIVLRPPRPNPVSIKWGVVTPGQSINLGNQWKPRGGCLRSKVDALMPRWFPFRSKIVTWTSIAKAWCCSAVRLHCVEVLMIMMLQQGFPRLRRLLLGTSIVLRPPRPNPVSIKWGVVTPGQSINLGNQWKPRGGCLRSKVDALMPRWFPFRSKIVTWTSIAKAWCCSAVRLHCVEVLMIMMLQQGFPRLRRLLLGTSIVLRPPRPNPVSIKWGVVTPGQSINLGNQWKSRGGCLRSKVDALMPRWFPFRSKIVTWTSIAKARCCSAVRLHCVEVLMIMMLQQGFPRLRRLLLGTSIVLRPPRPNPVSIKWGVVTPGQSINLGNQWKPGGGRLRSKVDAWKLTNKLTITSRDLPGVATTGKLARATGVTTGSHNGTTRGGPQREKYGNSSTLFIIHRFQHRPK